MGRAGFHDRIRKSRCCTLLDVPWGCSRCLPVGGSWGPSARHPACIGTVLYVWPPSCIHAGGPPRKAPRAGKEAGAVGLAAPPPPCVWGAQRFGDSVEDEWLVVWLLLKLTALRDDVAVQVRHGCGVRASSVPLLTAHVG